MNFPVLDKAQAVIQKFSRTKGVLGGGGYSIAFVARASDGSRMGPYEAFASESSVAMEIRKAYDAYGAPALVGAPIVISAHIEGYLYVATAVGATDETRKFIEKIAGAPLLASDLKRGKLIDLLPTDELSANYLVKIEADGRVLTDVVSRLEIDRAIIEMFEASKAPTFGPSIKQLSPEVEFILADGSKIRALRFASKADKSPGEVLSEAKTLLPKESPPKNAKKVKLVKVVDGDTIRVKEGQEEYDIRLLGIHTPETKGKLEEGGLSAFEFLKSILSGVEFVYFLEDPGNSPDQYGRKVGEVYASGYNLGKLLLVRGYAEIYASPLSRSEIADSNEYQKWYDIYKSGFEKKPERISPAELVEPASPFDEAVDDRDSVLGPLPKYGMRIGDCQFVVPPTSIRVTARSSSERIPLLRSKSSIARNTGHAAVIVEIELYFSSPEEINGKPVYDPKLNKVYYVNGLRSLIAQFKRTPFLPVENEFLNDVHGIYALALISLTVTTVPGFPGSIKAVLRAAKFDHTPYIPDADTLGECIVWPLFRYYYQKALCDRKDMPPKLPADGRTRLWSIPGDGFNSGFEFLVPQESAVAQIASAKATINSMDWVDSGHEPSSEFQKKYWDAKQLDQAISQRKKYKELKGDLGKYAEFLGYNISYDSVKFWPAYNPKETHPLFRRWSLGDAGKPPELLTSDRISFPCDLYIVELKSEQGQRLAARLYDRRGNPTKYFAIPADRVDIINALHFEPETFKEKVAKEASEGEKELTFEVRPLENLILTSIGVSYNNVLTSLQLQGMESPAFQYLGSQDAYIHATFETTDRDAIAGLKEICEYSRFLARTYRVGIEAGFVRFKNHLAQLFGIDAVVIDSVDVSTVDEAPGLFRVSVVMTSFDRTQRDRERLDLLTGELAGGRLESRGSDLYHEGYRILENKMKSLETYPDLELPTYKEINDVARKLGFNRTFKHPDPDVVYVDPDFYIRQTTTLKREVYELVASGFRGEIKDGIGNKQEISIPSDMAGMLKGFADALKRKEEAKDIASGKGAAYEAEPDATLVIAGPELSEARNLEKTRKWRQDRCYITPYRAYGSGITSSGKSSKSYHTARCASLQVGTVIWIPALSHLPNNGFFVIEDDAKDDPEYPSKASVYGAHRIGIFYSEHEGDIFPNPEKKGLIEGLKNFWENIFHGERTNYLVGRRKVLLDGRSEEVPIVEFAIVGKIDLKKTRDHSECRSFIRTLVGGEAKVKEQVKDPLAPIPDYSGTQNPIMGMLHDMFEHDCRGRLLRAFPTFQLFFVDEGRWITWWRLFDNLYGLNAVSSIDFYNSRKTAASTCVIRLSNVYGNITTLDVDSGTSKDLPWYKAFLSPQDPYFREIVAERLKGEKSLFLRPGARVHLRMGYGANAAGLPIVFNGTIAEIDTKDAVTVVAQGDGLELTAQVISSKVETFEPRNKIGEMLLGDMTPFQEFLYGATSGLVDPRHYHIVHFGSPHFIKNSVRYEAGEVLQNVYPGHGLAKMAESPESFPEALMEVWNVLAEWRSTYDEINVGLRMDGKSIWDVLQVLAGVVPDYIVSVVPFEFRSTLFYGRPYWLYVYSYDSSGFALKKPFWQLHFYHSHSDILANDIVASEDGVFTNVYLGFNLKGKSGSETAHVMVHADTDISPEKQKTAVIRSDLVLSTPIIGRIPLVNRIANYLFKYTAAFNYAQSLLVNFLKDMYKGTLTVIGDPTVKPHDPVYIFDTYTQMTGLVQVKEVVHHFSQETGFVTAIVPDCCVAGTDVVLSRLWYELSMIGSAAGSAGVLAFFKRRSIQEWIARQVARRFSKEGWQAFLSALKVDAGKALQMLSNTASKSELANLARGSISSSAAAQLVKAAPSKIKEFLAAACGRALISGLVSAAFYAVGKTIFEYLRRSAFYRQCVMVSPLRVAGREFSAGIEGSKGAVLGSTPGTIDKIIQKLFGWAGINYENQASPIEQAASHIAPMKETPVESPGAPIERRAGLSGLTPKEFIELLKPAAQNIERQTEYPWKMLVAQAALETGWLSSIPVDINTGKHSYNLFGIKGEGPAGSVTSPTTEEVGGRKQRTFARFRAYHSYEECMEDYVNLMLRRFAPALNYKSNLESMAREIQRLGYATDSKYAEKLIGILNGTLARY